MYHIFFSWGTTKLFSSFWLLWTNSLLLCECGNRNRKDQVEEEWRKKVQRGEATGIGGHLGGDVETSLHSMRMTLVRRILLEIQDMSLNQPSYLTRHLPVVRLRYQASHKICNVSDLPDMLRQWRHRTCESSQSMIGLIWSQCHERESWPYST